MVQYIHTPWRDQEELSRVRQQFYPASSPPSTQAHTHAHAHAHAFAYAATKSNNVTGISDESDENASDTTTPAALNLASTLALALDAEKRQQQAVSRVSMWMQRGGCPHLVESTALLTAAILSDLHESRTRANSSSYAIRAAYSAAFSRFVTGLLDGQQDRLRKMSMYSIAKTIGLPATFVELRHQATHEQLPSLAKLRSAANNALAWIWDFYWKDLVPANKGAAGANGSRLDARRDLLIRCLHEPDAPQGSDLQKQLRSWDEASLLRMLADIAESSEEPRVILRALQLSRTILGGVAEAPLTIPSADPLASRIRDLEAFRVELRTLNEELQDTRIERMDSPAQALDEASTPAPTQSVGWTRYQGTWTPKPIGVV